MTTCALVAAVEFNAEDFLARHAAGAFDFVMAVDGGFAHLQRAGVTPGLALGDFDSLGYVPTGVPVQRHPVHKDASDMELAFEEAVARGFSEAWAYGALSGRLDHTLANLQLFARFSERGMRVTGVGGGFAVRVLAGPAVFDVPVPQGCSPHDARGTVSVFSAGDRARGVTEHGLEYPLENAELTNRTSLGLSNELAGRPASVSVEEGTLYVFYPLVYT